MDKKDAYYKLVNRINTIGERRSKRHGEYVTVSLFNDYSLELDTWNKSIRVYKDNKYIQSLGIDFGGFRCDITMVKFWYAHLPIVNNT